MTPDTIVRNAAQQDLTDLADYLAERNLEAATRFSRAVQETFRQLAQLPGLGAPRAFGNPGWRACACGRSRGSGAT